MHVARSPQVPTDTVNQQLADIVMLGIKTGVILIAALRNWPARSPSTHRRIMVEAAITQVNPELFGVYGFAEIAKRFESAPHERYIDQERTIKPLSLIEQVVILGCIETAIETALATGIAVGIAVGIGRDDINQMLMIAASFEDVGVEPEI